MTRPRGVVAIAVVGILGSVGMLMLGELMAFYYGMLQVNPDAVKLPPGMPAAPNMVGAVVLGEAAGFLALGAFGMVASVGLLHQRNWARVAFLVFAALLLGSMLIIAAAMLTLIAAGPAGGPEFMVVAAAALLLVALGFGGAAGWWIVYLTQLHVRASFLGEVEAAAPRRGPISVTIIGWMLLIGGLSAPRYYFMSYPLIMFGGLLEGEWARVGLTLNAVVGCVAGMGLLRWWPRAHLLAMVFYSLGLLNVLLFALLPGALERYEEAIRAANPTSIPETMTSASYLGFTLALGFLAVSVPLYFLIVNRRRFLDACRPAPSAEDPLQT